MGINKIIGEIETLGQSTFDSTGQTYAYIRFMDHEGKVQMIDKIAVANNVNSYLNTGIEGEFILIDFPVSKTLKKFLIALKLDNGRKADDFEILKSVKKKLYFMHIVGLILTALASFIIIGIPFLIFTIYALYKFSKIPKNEQIEAFLNKNLN